MNMHSYLRTLALMMMIMMMLYQRRSNNHTRSYMWIKGDEQVHESKSNNNDNDDNNVNDKNNNNFTSNHHVGKIAFLFMTRGLMPLEDIWREFFSFNADPSHYSIYIHPHSGYIYPPSSLFYNRNVDDHIKHVDWGGMTQVRSIKHLVMEALKDPLNKRFCLMSETCIPLYPFNMFRDVLLSLNKSIVNACVWGGMEGDTRWRSSLTNAGWKKEHWRKSATWFALNREHATVFVNGSEEGWNDIPCCDEHYLPTILASHGLDNETTCSDGFAYANWPNDYVAHPTSFSATAINYKFIKALKTFHSNSQSNMNMKCSGIEPICHFTARKFTHGANFPLLKNLQWILNDIGHNISYSGNPFTHYRHMLRMTPGHKYFIIYNSELKRIPDNTTKDSILQELNLPLDIFETENISDITVLDHQYYRFGRVMLSQVDGSIYKSHMYNNPQLWYMLNGSRHALSNTAVLDHLNLTHHKIHIVDDYDLDFIPIGNPIK